MEKNRTISDLEKYCEICPLARTCEFFQRDKPMIDTCLYNGAIERGYKQAIEEAGKRLRIALCKMRTWPLEWHTVFSKLLAYVIYNAPLKE